MAWIGVFTVSEQRIAFVHRVLDQSATVAQACREFGISRKTGYKWLARFDAGHRPLVDQSRRPARSPERTPEPIVRAILAIRDRYHWGAAKIHVILTDRGLAVPSVRTVNAVLSRRGRVSRPASDPPATQRFERAQPNELWQLDFKGPVEVQRRRVHPLSILDDHSRYLLRLTPCENMQHRTTWEVLWELFGQVGLPDALLCDNHFNAKGSATCVGLSWFDAQLIRLGIRPRHGRPYHPQTQGKVERFHGTLNRELLPYVDRSTLGQFAGGLEHWRTNVYNSLRPHEALAMRTPVSRWRPSDRKRPDRIPPLDYAPGSLARKVQPSGQIAYRSCRILIGKGLAGDPVRLEESDGELVIYYATHPIRRLALSQLTKDTTL